MKFFSFKIWRICANFFYEKSFGRLKSYFSCQNKQNTVPKSSPLRVPEFFEQFLENFLKNFLLCYQENAEETSIYYYHIWDYKTIFLQSNEEPCMKFLLIIILQEPKEFGVPTSHMLLVVVAWTQMCARSSLSSHYRPAPQLPKLGTFQTFITLVVSVIPSLKLLFLSFT